MRKPYVTYSPELALRICALIAQGRTRVSLVGQPGMPSQATFARWLHSHADFARLYHDACARRAEAAALAGHRDAGRGGRPGRYTARAARTICALVAEGRPLRAIAQRPGAPGLSTIHKWLGEHDDFRRQYLAAWEQHARLAADETIEIADQALGPGWADAPAGKPPITARDALLHAKLRIETRLNWVGRIAPKGFGARAPEAAAGRTHEAWLEELG